MAWGSWGMMGRRDRRMLRERRIRIMVRVGWTASVNAGREVSVVRWFALGDVS